MDVIVVIPIDGDALYDVVKEAKDKGIYVICYDRIVGVFAIIQGGLDIVYLGIILFGESVWEIVFIICICMLITWELLHMEKK